MADTNVAKKKKRSLKSFFIETKAELRKVTWPTRSQLVNNTLVILVFVAVVAIVLALLDTAFAKVFEFITKLI